jgi:hypothetical protein
VRKEEAFRIPGLPVGYEVNTFVGKRKKVCFNISGTWFFRMADPDWRARIKKALMKFSCVLNLLARPA